MPEDYFDAEVIRQGRELTIGEVLFSRGTYQVEVVGDGVQWPFLQVTDEGHLADRFCSCGEEMCAHLAAAWLKIFNDRREPLHVRFRNSFLAVLCRQAGEQCGEEIRGSREEGFRVISKTKKKLFEMKGSGKQIIESWVQQKNPETEETSLKFSNLSAEELQLWKEGRPSPELSFELSFWSDLAKWGFLQQEMGKQCRIVFDSVEKLPRGVTIEFEEVEFFFYIAEADWNALVPSLPTVSGMPLEVHTLSHTQIRRVFYDVLKQAFHLDIDLGVEGGVEGSYQRVGEWVYVPREGFRTAKIDPLLREKEVSASQIGTFLKRHHVLVKQHLQGSTLHEGVWPARYHLFFDEEKNLHLTCYLFEKGDLQRPQVAKFDAWVFLPGKGFFLLGDVLFEAIETVIPFGEVAPFVTRHKHWLQAYDGFQTHIIAVGTRVGYSFTEKGLYFTTELDLSDNAEDVIDFQEWLYVQGRGFYAKDRSSAASALKGGLQVRRQEIDRFIREHRDELETVSGFWSTVSPLAASGIRLALTEEGTIGVTPLYTFTIEAAGKKIELFENYTFVHGEGFCEIPSHLKLPAPYSTPAIIDEHAEPYFVSYQIDTLKSYLLEVDIRLQKPEHLELQLTSLAQEEGGQWLAGLLYKTNLGELPAFEVWKAVSENKRYLFSSAGLILLNVPRYNWLRNIPKKRWLKKGEKLRLTTLEWIRLFAFEQMTPPEDDEVGHELWKQLHSMQAPTIPNLQGLLSKLRPYQETGLHWLWFLYSYGLSGLLCDEMGLGKTHQAMALLAAILESSQKGKFLVVCPTTVIFHWQDLLSRFLPKIRVLTYYGAGRSLDEVAEKYDLVLTSYGTLRTEKATFSDQEFAVAIFDEIQTAKNHLSQTHKVLKSLDATVRIGLTGTPIENHLLELKALFDLVLPGYMPTETTFKELFVRPIEKQQDVGRKKLLARLINPFILRRKKSEVLLELPEKVETIAYAPLSDEQKKLYQEVCAISRDVLLKELCDLSKPTPYLHVFALLSKLKQICDHPALYLDQEKDASQHTSGKWDLFVQLLQETRESSQKLVIFSQYLGMLDIIEEYLEKEKIGFASLRGSTRDRKEQVLRFRDDPTCEVFVGSLQAAGVGIDLISASVVIHYDRWWNPAKENQATDRVHRMGQSRGVQVFKLVTRGTLEESLHALIEKKLALAEGILGYDEQTEFKTLSREDLIELVQMLDHGV